MISSKIHESCPLKTQNFAHFDKNMLLEYEFRILNAINFNAFTIRNPISMVRSFLSPMEGNIIIV